MAKLKNKKFVCDSCQNLFMSRVEDKKLNRLICPKCNAPQFFSKH